MHRRDVRRRTGNVIGVRRPVGRLAAVVDERERRPGLFAPPAVYKREACTTAPSSPRFLVGM